MSPVVSWPTPWTCQESPKDRRKSRLEEKKQEGGKKLAVGIERFWRVWRLMANCAVILDEANKPREAFLTRVDDSSRPLKKKEQIVGK
ncbi:hypothetical protein TNCV_3057951 [Trichonephila clavipes]|nr:hypothetical protein TNCV_3057951 [Trichonephila clavipes]